MKTVSVIMPVFNAEKTLHKSIESLIFQTSDNWELIAVDDGSTDSSLKILEDYSKNNPKIKVIHQNNSGPGAARNTAIKNAQGEYIAFLDADDLYDSDFIESINGKIETEDKDLIFYDLICERENGDIIRTIDISKYRNLSKTELIRYQMTGKLEWGMVKVIRKKIISDNDLAFSCDSVGEEAIFSFSALNCAESIEFIDKAIYHYVFISDGQHKKGGEDPWRDSVLKMKQHLISLGEYEKYKRTVNSLALKALLIACYRSSLNRSYKIAKQKIKEKLEAYKKEYDLKNIDKDALDRTTLFLYRLVRRRLVFPIYLASVARSRNKK